MNLISKITSNPLQTQSLVLDDGSAFALTMYFRSMQYGWFLNNLTYNDFVLNGLRICNSPNMLYQWQNVLPFGLACYSSQNREPSQQDDFLSGASKLYVLTQAECVQYANYVKHGQI